MSGLNKVIIMGNLGADPELRVLPGGLSILKMRIATSERWQDKEKNWQERTEWHRVTVFGPRAEHLAKFLRKGMVVTVDGQIRTSTYEKEGQKRYSTEVVANFVWSPNVPGGDKARLGEAGDPFSAPLTFNGSNGRAPAPAAVDIPF